MRWTSNRGIFNILLYINISYKSIYRFTLCKTTHLYLDCVLLLIKLIGC